MSDITALFRLDPWQGGQEGRAMIMGEKQVVKLGKKLQGVGCDQGLQQQAGQTVRYLSQSMIRLKRQIQMQKRNTKDKDKVWVVTKDKSSRQDTL